MHAVENSNGTENPVKISKKKSKLRSKQQQEQEEEEQKQEKEQLTEVGHQNENNLRNKPNNKHNFPSSSSSSSSSETIIGTSKTGTSMTTSLTDSYIVSKEKVLSNCTEDAISDKFSKHMNIVENGCNLNSLPNSLTPPTSPLMSTNNNNEEMNHTKNPITTSASKDENKSSPSKGKLIEKSPSSTSCKIVENGESKHNKKNQKKSKRKQNKNSLTNDQESEVNKNSNNCTAPVNNSDNKDEDDNRSNPSSSRSSSSSSNVCDLEDDVEKLKNGISSSSSTLMSTMEGVVKNIELENSNKSKSLEKHNGECSPLLEESKNCKENKDIQDNHSHKEAIEQLQEINSNNNKSSNLIQGSNVSTLRNDTIKSDGDDNENNSNDLSEIELPITTSSNGLDSSNIIIQYKEYESDLQMQDIMRLIQTELSEPYSIYTYRYFIYNWPKLCFLASHGNEYVGAIVCKLDMHMNVKRGYIAMLAVKKEYRKLKIGTTLVQKAIEAMLADSADEVVLETEMKNIPALRLYENLGFVRDKRLFRYYLNGVDALRLKLWFR